MRMEDLLSHFENLSWQQDYNFLFFLMFGSLGMRSMPTHIFITSITVLLYKEQTALLLPCPFLTQFTSFLNYQRLLLKENCVVVVVVVFCSLTVPWPTLGHSQGGTASYTQC